jgi:hypothetical protein
MEKSEVKELETSLGTHTRFMLVKRARFFARVALKAFESNASKIKSFQILFQARTLFALVNVATRFITVKRARLFASIALESFARSFFKIFSGLQQPYANHSTRSRG